MFNADVPIKKADDDLLNRSKFSKQLATAMFNYQQNDSFNIGLYGKCGSGKTSIINMITEELEQLSNPESSEGSKDSDNKPIVLRFNPWLFSDQNQLIIQFFKQLGEVFQNNKLKSIGKSLKNFGYVLELASYFPKVGFIGKILAPVVIRFGKRLSGKSTNIQELKDELVAKLEKLESKIIIIIDDIDRLPNNEIRSVFQLVKSIADFPNTLYLLTFDYDIVTRALGEVQNSKGEEYLGKIIQVPFNLPPISDAQIKLLFFKQLNKILGEMPEEIFSKYNCSLLYNSGIKPFLKNMRDVRRLNNTISLKYSFLKDEVDIIDFLGITTIQVFAPNIYATLANYKDTLCGTFNSRYQAQYTFIENDKKHLKALYEKILSISASANKNHIRAILAYLFPKINSIDKSNILAFNNSSEAKQIGKIYDNNYFDRFFSLSLEVGLSLVKVKDIIFNAPEKDIESIILNIADKDQADLFLEYIMSTFENLKSTNKYSDRVKILMVAILKTWPSFSIFVSEYYFFYTQVFILKKLVQILLRVFSDKKERNEILILIFANEDISLGIKANILIMLGNKHDEYINNKEKEKKLELLSIENINILEDNFAQALLKASTDNLLDDIYFLNIKGFCEFSENIEIKNIFSNFITEISEDTSLKKAKFISLLIYQGKSYGTSILHYWLVDYQSIGSYLDIEKSIDQMKYFAVSPEFSNLSLKQQKDIIAFIIFKTQAKELAVILGKNITRKNIATQKKYITKAMIDNYAKNNNIVLNQ